jgi:hypothetical protein
MRYCPKCRSEYQDWVTACLDCGSPTTNALPSDPSPELSRPEERPVISEKFITVGSFSNELEAKLYQEVLKAESVPSYVLNEQLINGSANCIGEVILRVKESDAEKALEIFKTTTQESPEYGGLAEPNDLDEPPELDEAEDNDQRNGAASCPICQSADIHSRVSLAAIFGKGKLKCRNCGYEWQN